MIVARMVRPRLQIRPSRNSHSKPPVRISRFNSQNSMIPTCEQRASCRSEFAFLPNMISILCVTSLCEGGLDSGFACEVSGLEEKSKTEWALTVGE
jgi:hypothetical protein